MFTKLVDDNIESSQNVTALITKNMEINLEFGLENQILKCRRGKLSTEMEMAKNA